MNTPLQNPHGDSHFLAYYVPILIVNIRGNRIVDYSVSFTNKLPLKLLLFIHITFYNHAANTSKSFCWMDGTMDRWLAWQRGSWCVYVVCGSPNKHYLRRRLIPLYISILIKWGRHTTTSLWVYWWTTTASGWVDGWLHNRESYI